MIWTQLTTGVKFPETEIFSPKSKPYDVNLENTSGKF